MGTSLKQKQINYRIGLLMDFKKQNKKNPVNLSIWHMGAVWELQFPWGKSPGD